MINKEKLYKDILKEKQENKQKNKENKEHLDLHKENIEILKKLTSSKELKELKELLLKQEKIQTENYYWFNNYKLTCLYKSYWVKINKLKKKLNIVYIGCGGYHNKYFLIQFKLKNDFKYSYELDNIN